MLLLQLCKKSWSWTPSNTDQASEVVESCEELCHMLLGTLAPIQKFHWGNGHWFKTWENISLHKNRLGLLHSQKEDTKNFITASEDTSRTPCKYNCMYKLEFHGAMSTFIFLTDQVYDPLLLQTRGRSQLSGERSSFSCFSFSSLYAHFLWYTRALPHSLKWLELRLQSSETESVRS